MKILSSLTGLSQLASILVFTGVIPAHAALNVYISKPGDQTVVPSSLASNTSGSSEYTFYTETFSNGSALGAAFNPALSGTSSYSGSITLNANNSYGGYNTGNYLSVSGINSQATLTLNKSVNYFGFLWTAGDGGNELAFYNDQDQLIGFFTTNYLMSVLQRDTTTKITTVDNQEYYTGYYYGKPSATWPGTNTQNVPPNFSNLTNGNEPYAYIHFINDDENAANRIKKIVFTQKTTAGFESDNHTIRLKSEDLNPKDLIYIKAVPEPSVIGLMMSSLAIVCGLRRKRSI